VRVPHAPASLVPLPPGVDPTHWASLSDNIPFGYELTVPHLLRNPGADVLIMGGCGSVALYAAAFARAAGAGAVDYIDTDRTRLDIATKLGANAIEMPPPRRHGSYPITVDASMSAESLRCAIRSTEPEGQCSSVGCHFGDVAMPMMEMYVRGINFYAGRGQGRPNIEKAMAFVDAQRVRTELVTTEVMPFDAAPEVLARGSMKPVLVRPPVSSTKACGITQHSGRISCHVHKAQQTILSDGYLPRPPAFSLSDYRAISEAEIGRSEWVLIDQPMIDAFAAQLPATTSIFTSIRPRQKARSRHRRAHGFLTLSRDHRRGQGRQVIPPIGRVQ
jgi:hypothetical protein